MTISAQYGLVDQIEFFNKIVASKSLKGYYLLNNGEFAYNKSYSNGYPFGAVKRLDKYENGAISTLYICFKVNDKMNSDLMKEYFETDKWYKEIYKIAVEGARNHGLLNIAVGDFFNTKHILPTNMGEQEKIANFLIEVNKKIDLLENKLLNYQNFKKYLMQQIFAQKLRFADCTDEWHETKIGNIAEVVGGGTPKTEIDRYWNGDIKWYTPSEIGKTKYIEDSERHISDEGLKNSSAKLLPANTILLSSRATVGEVSIALTECATNQGFQSLITKNNVDNEFIYYLISTIKNEFIRRASGSTFLEISKKEIQRIPISIPSLNEQEQIGNVLSNIDKQIFYLNDIIGKNQEFKKGLLQQMFV